MEINNFNDYLIYKDGRVYNNKLKRFLRGSIVKGYVRIQLRNKRILLHRLVAEHYIANPHNYPQVDHLDRNKLNNNIENLRWVNSLTNNNNKNLYKSNTSGHQFVRYNNRYYVFRKIYNKKECKKYFKSLTDALCYKYIFLLKLKSNIYIND